MLSAPDGKSVALASLCHAHTPTPTPGPPPGPQQQPPARAGADGSPRDARARAVAAQGAEEGLAPEFALPDAEAPQVRRRRLVRAHQSQPQAMMRRNRLVGAAPSLALRHSSDPRERPRGTRAGLASDVIRTHRRVMVRARACTPRAPRAARRRVCV